MALARLIAALFSPFRTRSADPRHVLGRRGEKLAARHLRRHGLKILHRNFRPLGGGEIDLVCRDGKTLAFVEVKTRSSDTFARPADAVDDEKRALMARGARSWLHLLDRRDIVYRFDIVEVILAPGKEPRITHHRAAFVPEGANR